MTQKTKATWISGIFFIAPIVAFTFLAIFSSKQITIGNSTMNVGGSGIIALIAFIYLIFIIASIAFVVQGFRVHWVWGLLNLLVPLAFVAFCIVHPRAARIPMIFLGFGIGWLLILLTLMTFFKS
jgi:hypothetical protein